LSEEFDIAVIGSTPFALFLAGLLAREHRRRVALVGDVPSPFRIDRGIDVSVGPITRPETWGLLQDAVPEAVRMLAQIGRGVVGRAPLAVFADDPATRIALQHVRHVALGFGHSVLLHEGVPGRPESLVFRDIRVVRRAAFASAIGPWLDSAGLRRLTPGAHDVVLRRNGSVAISGPRGRAIAALGILADDDALMRHLDADERDPLLSVVDALAVLTTPVRRLPEALALYPDRGLALRQHATRAVSAVMWGASGSATRRLGLSLPAGHQARRAGEAVFRMVRTLDGAPLVGRVPGMRVQMIAGLGETGLFQAPAIARLLCGTATEAERAYYVAREPGRGPRRANVAEFAAAVPAEASA